MTTGRKSFAFILLISGYILVAPSILWAESKVGALGRIQPGNGLVYLMSASDDLIADILVRKDDVVTQGTPLVVLQSQRTYETEVALAQVELENADKLGAEAIALQKLHIRELEQQQVQSVALQELRLAQAREDQRIALTRFERLQEVGETYSSQELETAEYNLKIATLHTETAEQELARLKSEYTLQHEIANRELQRLVVERSMNIKTAQHNLTLAQERLRLATLRAPVDGTIMEVFRHSGEVAVEGEPIIMMADLQHMFVIGEIFESDVLKIAPDMPVTITSKALPEPLSGQVESISRVLSIDSKVAEVTIRLDSPDIASQLINLEVSISIELQTR